MITDVGIKVARDRTLRTSGLLKNNFIYVFILGCSGFSRLCGLFSSFGELGLLSSCDARASHCGSFPCCGAQALELGFTS